MAVYSLTLDSLKFCNTDGFSRDYGTKKTSSQNGGSLTTSEFNENIAKTFDTERPIVVNEDSSCGSVEYNANIAMVAAGIEFTLGSGAFIGVKVKFTFNATGSIKFTDKSGEIVTKQYEEDSIVNLYWNGEYWADALNDALTDLAEERSFSNTAHKTGKKWIDGKDIYEIVIGPTVISTTNSNDYQALTSLIPSYVVGTIPNNKILSCKVISNGMVETPPYNSERIACVKLNPAGSYISIEYVSN